MSIFGSSNYKEIVREWVKEQPKNGYGQFKIMAEFLNMSNVTISQIFKGEKHLSLEQAHGVTKFLNLTTLAKDYFILLVQLERAGSRDLEDYYQEKIKELRLKATQLNERLSQDRVLTEKDKSKFYSHWMNSAVRLASAIDEFRTPQALAKRFQVPEAKIVEVMNFLIDAGLCIEDEKGFRMGPKRIHLEAGSPFIKSRQVSWRLKGFERMENLSEDELFYTAPMSVALPVAHRLRENLVELIEKTNAEVANEKPNDLFCLNIDLFRY